MRVRLSGHGGNIYILHVTACSCLNKVFKHVSDDSMRTDQGQYALICILHGDVFDPWFYFVTIRQLNAHGPRQNLREALYIKDFN